MQDFHSFAKEVPSLASGEPGEALLCRRAGYNASKALILTMQRTRFRAKKLAIGCSAATAILVGLIIVKFDYTRSWPCTNIIDQNVLSPDGQIKAIAYDRNCGIDYSYSSQVGVINAKENLPRRADLIFVAQYSAPITVKWVGQRHLQITYPPQDMGEIYQQAGGIFIWSGFHSTWVSVTYKKANTVNAAGDAPSQNSAPRTHIEFKRP